MTTVALLVLGATPFVVLLAILGLRAPVGFLLLAYAAIVPFGSAIDLPLPLPPPFDTLSSVAGAAAITGMVAHLLLSRSSAPRLDRSMPIWLLFMGVAAISYAWSIAPRTTVREFLLLASGMGLFLLAGLMPATAREVRRIGTAVIAGATVASVLALGLLATGRTPVGRSGTPRFVITGDDPNHTAAGLLLPLALALGRALDSRMRASHRAAAAAASGLMGLGIVLTGSRGGLVAALIAVAVVALQDMRPARLMAAVVALVMVAGTAAVVAPPELGERLTSTSSTGRTDIWRLGLDACSQYCVLGSGWGTFPDVYQDEFVTNPRAGGFRDEGYRAHNIWLQAAVETGLLGAVLLVVAYALTLLTASRLPRDLRGPCVGALVGLAVASSLISNLIFKYFWLVPTYVLVAAAASRRAAAAGRRSPEPPGPDQYASLSTS